MHKILTKFLLLTLCSTSVFALEAEQRKADIDKAMAAYQSMKSDKSSILNLGELPKANTQIAIPSIQSIVDASKKSKQEMTVNPKQKLKLFVSFSMPELALKKYIHEADKIGRDNIEIVLRGNKKGLKLQGTVNYIGQLTKGKDVDFQIDPPSFERFGVTQVPTLVAYVDDPALKASCDTTKGKEKAPEHFEGVLGGVSIKYALENMIDRPNTQFRELLTKNLQKLSTQY